MRNMRRYLGKRRSISSGLNAALCLGFSLFVVITPVLAQVLTNPQKREEANQIYQRARNVTDDDSEQFIRNAISQMSKAVSLYEEAGDFNSGAVLRIEIGWMYEKIGDYAECLKSYQKAQEIFHRNGNPSGEAVALNSAGWIYRFIGEYQKSLDCHFIAEPLYESIHDRRGIAMTQSSIGGVYLRTGEYQRALEFLQRSLKIRLEIKEDFDVAMNYLDYGMIYRNLGDQQKAIFYLNKAYEIMSRFSEHRQTAHTLNEPGNCYRELKKPREALNYFNKALSHSRLIANTNDIGVTLSNLMNVWSDLSQPILSTMYGKQAINAFQDFRTRTKKLDKDSQKTYINLISPTYTKLADNLISQGRISEAELVLSMLKDEELFEYVRRDDKVAKELLAKLSLSPAERHAFKRYDELADNLTKLGSEYGELQVESKKYKPGEFPRQARVNELEKLIADANRVFNAFVDSLKVKLGVNDFRVAAADSGMPALLKGLNQPRTVIISTIVGEDRLNLIVTTAETQRAHTVDLKATQLNKLVIEFRAAAKDRKMDPRPAGKKLYDALFPAALQKDLENIKADTIVWSLDGTLRYAPIAALWDGRQYLAERYANVIITLASRDKLVQEPTDREQWQALGVGVSKEIAGFEALSGVPEELCEIVHDPQAQARCHAAAADTKDGVIPGRTLLDEEFNLQAFKNNLGRYSVVHIASHFSLNPGNETNSYLLLGAGVTNDERKLTLDRVRGEFQTKFVGVELLTLSACNTAMTGGERANGLEIESFGAIAQKEGARAVLATLWAVADSSTRDLMTEFYRLLETNKQLGKAEALRRAQLDLLHGKHKADEVARSMNAGSAGTQVTDSPKPFVKDPLAPFSHPYYWSPFVLFGNWR